MSDRPALLLFEPDIDGHPREWLGHIVRYAAADRRDYTVNLLLSPALAAEMRHAHPDLSPDRVRFLAIGAFEHWLCAHPSLLVRAFARWWVMRRHAQRIGAQYVHFQAIDHLALPLALGLGLGGRAISGILFRPSVHYAEFDRRRARIKERLRDLRKSFLYRRMLAHPQLRHVFSLDPYFPSYSARRDANGTKVRAIPDPISPERVPSAAAESDAPFHGGRTTFLLFGHLTKRKGLLILLDALAALRPEAASRIAVVLAGGVEAPLRRRVNASLAALARDRPDLIVTLEDRRLHEAELQTLIERIDVVIAPYQRFVGSSGVLLWAARAGKPVVAQDYGLVGRLVRDHGLGVVVDTTDHEVLAQTLEWTALTGGEALVDRRGAAAFIAGQTPEAFAAIILEDLVEHADRKLSQETRVSLAPA